MADVPVKGPLTFTGSGTIEAFDSDFVQLNGGGGYVGISSAMLTMLFGDNTTDFVHRDNVGTYTADQYAAATLQDTPGGTAVVMFLLRASGDTGANRDFYLVRLNGSTTVERYNNGTLTTVGTPSISWASGDAFKARAITNGANCDIVILKNGTVAATISDTSPLASGKPGQGFRMSSAGFMRITALELGNVTAGDTTPPDITSTGTGSTNGPFAANAAEETTAAFITLTASEAVTWGALGGADASRFVKLNVTGTTVQLGLSPALSFESLPHANPFVVTVPATDGASNARTVTVNVTVTNVTELPGTPTIGTATAGNASASVSFTPPAAGSAPTVTSYTVTATPGGLTGTGASSPITVSGLTNGTAYTFKVKAQNSDGFSPESAASNSVTPSAGGGGTAGFDFHTAVGCIFSNVSGSLAGLGRETAGRQINVYAKTAGTDTTVASATALTLDSNARLPRWTDAALVLGTQYDLLFCPVDGGKPGIRRMVAT